MVLWVYMKESQPQPSNNELNRLAEDELSQIPDVSTPESLYSFIKTADSLTKLRGALMKYTTAHINPELNVQPPYQLLETVEGVSVEPGKEVFKIYEMQQFISRAPFTQVAMEAMVDGRWVQGREGIANIPELRDAVKRLLTEIINQRIKEKGQ